MTLDIGHWYHWKQRKNDRKGAAVLTAELGLGDRMPVLQPQPLDWCLLSRTVDERRSRTGNPRGRHSRDGRDVRPIEHDKVNHRYFD